MPSICRGLRPPTVCTTSTSGADSQPSCPQRTCESRASTLLCGVLLYARAITPLSPLECASCRCDGAGDSPPPLAARPLCLRRACSSSEFCGPQYALCDEFSRLSHRITAFHAVLGRLTASRGMRLVAERGHRNGKFRPCTLVAVRYTRGSAYRSIIPFGIIRRWQWEAASRRWGAAGTHRCAHGRPKPILSFQRKSIARHETHREPKQPF